MKARRSRRIHGIISGFITATLSCHALYAQTTPPTQAPVRAPVPALNFTFPVDPSRITPMAPPSARTQTTEDFKRFLTADGLVSLLLLPLRDYLRDAPRDTVVVRGPNYRVLTETGTGKSVRISIGRSRLSNGLIEKLIFSSPGQAPGTLSLKRIGSGVRPTSDGDLLEGYLPAPSTADEYLLTLDGGGLQAHFIKRGSAVQGHFSFTISSRVIEVYAESDDSKPVSFRRYKLTYDGTELAPMTVQKVWFDEDTSKVDYLFDQQGTFWIDAKTFFSAYAGTILGIMPYSTYMLTLFATAQGWPALNRIQ